MNAMGFRRAAVLASMLVWSAAVQAVAADLRLIEAAKSGDAGAVKELIGKGADVNAPQADGATALHWAAHLDDGAVADLLIAARANVNAADGGGVTPLVLASTNGSASMVGRLLKAGAKPDLGRETPVMAAARSGNADVMRLLLEAGGDPNSKEPVRGQTALMWAASERHPDVVRMLIGKGADVHARTVVEKPAGTGRPGGGGGGGGMRPSANGANGFTPLLFAARVGDLESVRVLVEAGANVNDAASDGLSALVLATVRGNAPVAMHLLEKGADPNAAGAGYTALHWVAGSWETELTVTSITPEREGEEWVTVAGVKEGRLELVKSLLQHGADVNARITRTPPRVGSSKNPGLPELVGATPFLLAAMAGSPDIMRVLADKGADVRLGTARKGTPLMAAAGLGRVLGEVIVPESDTLAAAKLLFEMGAADANAVDELGNTALHYAAYMRRDTIVQLLADQGATLEIRNTYGETPLWLAECIVQFAGGGRYEVAPSSTGTLLRKLGAKPSKPDYDTLRPRYWPDIPHV
jgi:ankyrin repeat protein